MRSRDRIALVACAVTLLYCALALGGSVNTVGGVARWAALGAVAGALATVIPYAGSRQRMEARSPLLLVIAIAIGLTAMQLVPFPASLTAIVASQKAQLVADHARAWGTEPPSLVAVSYDPPATLLELAKLCGYAALAFAALRIASHRDGRKALGLIVAGAAGVVAIVTVAHEAVGASSIYGLYVPPVHNRLVSPIINANHLSSLMAMSVPVAIGVALCSDGVRRVLCLLVAVLCAAIALLIDSRGGALGLAIGLVVTTAVLLLQRYAATKKRERMPLGTWIPVVVIAGCAVTLLVTLTAGRVFEELSATHLGDLRSSGSKFLIVERAAGMLAANPVMGTGRGAFESAFTRWSEGGSVAYTYVENSYVQPVVDWGIAGALAIGIAALLLVRRALRRWLESPLEAGALGGLVALAAHELADFSLELPIVAMFAIVLFAILAPPRLVVAKSSQRRSIRLGLLAVGATVCVLATTRLGRSARAESIDASAPAAERLELAMSASDRHPADYWFLGTAALALEELHDPRAGAVISRALFLNPTDSTLHWVAASILMDAREAVQAQAELAQAVRFAPPEKLPDLLEAVVTAFPDADEAARAFPLDLDDAPEIARVLTEHHHELVALAYTRRLALLNPLDGNAQLLCARAAIATKQGELAVTMARDAFRIQPSADAAIALGAALELAGNSAEGIRAMRDALASGVVSRSPDRVRVLTAILDLQLATGDLAPAAKTLDELALLVSDRDGRITVLMRRATLHERLGEANQAKWDREQVRKLASGAEL